MEAHFIFWLLAIFKLAAYSTGSEGLRQSAHVIGFGWECPIDGFSTGH
jgi:hypothetical protein